jgi:hypothetical protein
VLEDAGYGFRRDFHNSSRGALETTDAVQQGCLAATVIANEQKKITAAQFEVDAVKDDPSGPNKAQI